MTVVTSATVTVIGRISVTGVTLVTVETVVTVVTVVTVMTVVTLVILVRIVEWALGWGERGGEVCEQSLYCNENEAKHLYSLKKINFD